MLKSPAMMEALKPRIGSKRKRRNRTRWHVRLTRRGLSIYKLERQVKVSLEKEQLREAKGKKIDASLDLGEEPQEPAAFRFRTNDTSYEALGEILHRQSGRHPDRTR